KKLPRGRKKTSVAFSHKTERSEVDYLRTLIELIYEKGMSFTRDADACTLFVGDEEINNKKAKKISLEEFEKLVGFTEPRVYDDRAFLTEYFETKINK
ncbi:MAG: hypothetical protein IJS67_05240, partial [Clostridia bacterium]|nr:hypothetical protein [Clostridia bacterium]